MRNLVLLILISFCAAPSSWSYQRMRSSGVSDAPPTLSYDLGASFGSYGGYDYSEINLGLNWHVRDWINWRNSVFARFGSGESASGLDTSARFEYRSGGDQFGFLAFAGPGYRFSSKTLSGVFGEGGLVFGAGGLHLGIGAKVMSYNSPGVDVTGRALPKTDTTYLLILGGGGVL